MVKKKVNNKNKNWVWAALAIAVFIYGGQHDWFKSTITNDKLDTTIINQLERQDYNPTSCYLTFDKTTYDAGENIQMTISDGYNQGCDVYVNPNNLGWIFFDSIITNSYGLATATGSLTNPGTFLVRAICGDCITNTKQITITDASTCIDTDGKNKLVPGHATSDGISYYDDCAGNWAVIEYFCNGNILTSEVIGCDAGYICTETRSGDYCMLIDHGYDEGETILTESDDGTMGNGINSIINPIEMDDIVTGGDCSLGVKIDVWWNYVNEEDCSNLQGFEQMAFYFYDSNTGIALDVPRNVQKHFDFCPKYYDGTTDWRFEMTKLMSMYTCQIDYDYTLQVYACECGQ